jgi:TolB protein
VAFASSRSGYWDIYLLSLNNGDLTRLTDSLNYDAAPAWSPDNQWVVYETYLNDNLEIYIQSVADAQNVIRLTENPAADFNPVWSPAGRQIAFVSDRGGENDIWLADLDQAEEKRFQNISLTPNSADTHPAWSPDGTSIVWVGEQDGMHSLFVQDLSVSDDSGSPASNTSRSNLGSGDWPAWSPDGESILTVL